MITQSLHRYLRHVDGPTGPMAVQSDKNAGILFLVLLTRMA